MIDMKPVRMCIGCGAKKEKHELLKITKNKENTIKIDKTGKNEGRGAYICYNTDCLDKCIKTKQLERSLRTKIENKIYDELRGVILDKQ